MNINWSLNTKEAEFILKSLAEHPYKTVAPLIQRLEADANAQLESGEKARVAAAKAESKAVRAEKARKADEAKRRAESQAELDKHKG